MIATTEIELKKLIQDFEKDWDNLDLINSLAIGYFENTSMQNDNEELKYFELAYLTRKTVKSSHNLAWYLYFESGDEDRAIKIQKECIELLPKSYYPYYLYGYMLLDKNNYEEAIPFLNKAYQIGKRRDILYNIGYCYFQMGDIEKSKESFSKSVSELDVENRSLYGLAICEWKLNNFEQVKIIADKLIKEIETKDNDIVTGYEIGLLYFLLNDLKQASRCLIKQGINGIDLIDWPELSYPLYKTNKELWFEKINNRIIELKEWYIEIENNHEDWNNYSDEEKKEELSDINAEINFKQEILNKEMTKPIINLNKKIWEEHCGCLLFDCKRHNNIEND